VNANTFSQPHALVVLWAQVPMEIANGCGSMLSGSVRSLRLSALRCSAGLGGWRVLQQWHQWLVDPPPSVYEMFWRVLVLVAIWAMKQGRKRLWSFVHTPSRQGFAVRQAVSKASTSFSSALHDFAWHDRPVPAKGWDDVGPDHPFLSFHIQVLMRQCIAVGHPP
jgi:hypothetical protein